MEDKYEIKQRNNLGLITIVEKESGIVVFKCKSVTKAAFWLWQNENRGE